MKRTVLNQLIQRLKDEVDDNHFNMAAWLSKVTGFRDYVEYDGTEESIPYCKTAGCIAGQVILMLTPKQRQESFKKWSKTYVGCPPSAYIEQHAREILGITHSEGCVLFAPLSMTDLHKIKREHAIAALEGIRDTGQLNWRKAAPHVPDYEWNFGPYTPQTFDLTD